MKTVEFLVKEINKLTGLTIEMDEPCVEQAKEMENYKARQYAEFCISRRKAELSDVDFFTWIDINKNYDSTRKSDSVN
jgi:hypothetical protein